MVRRDEGSMGLPLGGFSGSLVPMKREISTILRDRT